MKKSRREIILDEIDECENNMIKIILERDIARIGGDEETHQECLSLIKNEFANILKRKEILLQILASEFSSKKDFLASICITSDF